MFPKSSTIVISSTNPTAQAADPLMASHSSCLTSFVLKKPLNLSKNLPQTQAPPPTQRPSPLYPYSIVIHLKQQQCPRIQQAQHLSFLLSFHLPAPISHIYPEALLHSTVEDSIMPHDVNVPAMVLYLNPTARYRAHLPITALARLRTPPSPQKYENRK